MFTEPCPSVTRLRVRVGANPLRLPTRGRVLSPASEANGCPALPLRSLGSSPRGLDSLGPVTKNKAKSIKSNPPPRPCAQVGVLSPCPPAFLGLRWKEGRGAGLSCEGGFYLVCVCWGKGLGPRGLCWAPAVRPYPSKSTEGSASRESDGTSRTRGIRDQATPPRPCVDAGTAGRCALQWPESPGREPASRALRISPREEPGRFGQAGIDTPPGCNRLLPSLGSSLRKGQGLKARLCVLWQKRARAGAAG